MPSHIEAVCLLLLISDICMYIILFQVQDHYFSLETNELEHNTWQTQQVISWVWCIATPNAKIDVAFESSLGFTTLPYTSQRECMDVAHLARSQRVDVMKRRLSLFPLRHVQICSDSMDWREH